jgi:hypothetical protein
VIEAGSLTKEVRRISRAVRLTVVLRRRLAPRDVAAFLAFAPPSSSNALAHLSPLLPKVFSACNFSALLIPEGKPAIMPESDGNTKDLGVACYVCFSECILAVKSHGRSFWIDRLFRSEWKPII